MLIETMAEIKEQYPALVSHELQLLASVHIQKWPGHLINFKYDTISIYLENNTERILKIRRWGPKRLRILAAKFGLDLYPESDAFSTGINSRMDAIVHARGLYEWSCIDPIGNTTYLRKDGLLAKSILANPSQCINILQRGTIDSELNRLNEEHPLH